MGSHDLEVPLELAAQIHAEPSGRRGQIPLDAGGAEQADALLDGQIPLYLSAHPDHLCKNLPHHLGGFAEIHLLIARDLPNANAVDAGAVGGVDVALNEEVGCKIAFDDFHDLLPWGSFWNLPAWEAWRFA